MPIAARHREVAAELRGLAGGRRRAWRAASAACAFSFSTSASGSPPALILAVASSASFFQSARVSFSLASAVISMARGVVLLEELPVGQLGDRDREEHPGQVHDRHQVRDDQDDVLGHLGPGHRPHPAEHRAEQHAEEPDEHADVEVEPDEAGDDQADPGHLRDEVGEGAGDGADDADEPRGCCRRSGRPGSREWCRPELPEVGAEEDGEQQVAARPAHDVGQAGEALGRQRAAHRDERRRRHPVRAGGHAVVDTPARRGRPRSTGRDWRSGSGCR